MFLRPARKQRQTGVISIMAAAALGVAIIVAALALDLGHVYLVRRDVQKAADLASLSAVTDLSNDTVTMTIAENIAEANGYIYPNPATANTLVVNPGIYDWTTYVFTPGGAVTDRNAVQVTVGTTVDYFFLPGGFPVQATAISAREDIASFSLGSSLADIDTKKSALLNPILGGLLGGAVDLTLVGYQGVAAGNVTLGELQLALGLGTVDELLKADLTLADLIGATITVLERKGSSAVALSSLRDLQLAVSPALSLPLGTLLNVTTGSPEAAVNASVNVLQLITLAAQVANGKHFVDIPNLGISLPGVATISLALSVVEPPTIAIGPARCKTPGSCSDTNVNDWVTTAHTAQLRLKLNLSLLNLLSGKAGEGLINLPLFIEAAKADAALTKAHKAQCGAVSTENDKATILTAPQLLSVYIGDVSGVPLGVMENRKEPLTADMVEEAALVNLPLLGSIMAKVPLSLPGSAGAPMDFTGPFPNDGTVASWGIGSKLNPLLQEPLQPGVVVRATGLLAVLDPVLGLVAPLLGVVLGVLGTVLDSLLDPLLSLLGIQLAAADVTVLDVSCGAPQLVY